jgi:Uma2 family endonuclease
MASNTIAPWAEPALLSAEQMVTLADDGWRYELVEGRLMRMPPTGFEHGGLEAVIAAALQTFVRDAGLGRVVSGEPGFLLSRPDEPDTVLAPDIAFISTDRVPSPGSHEWTSFPRICPDLVVEIASPGQGRPHLGAKAARWLDAGARLVWIVWPGSRQVDVWRHGSAEPETIPGDRVVSGEDVLPGLALPLSELFA